MKRYRYAGCLKVGSIPACRRPDVASRVRYSLRSVAIGRITAPRHSVGPSDWLYIGTTNRMALSFDLFDVASDLVVKTAPSVCACLSFGNGAHPCDFFSVVMR